MMKNTELDFLKWQFDYNLRQIATADGKMHFLAAVYLGMSGIFFLTLRSTTCPQAIQCGIVRFVNLFASVTYMATLFCFLYLFARAIRPRTKHNLSRSYSSLIFWKHVAHIDSTRFKEIPFEDRYQDLFHQILITASIAEEKFRFTEAAYKVFLCSVVAFVVPLFTQLFL